MAIRSAPVRSVPETTAYPMMPAIMAPTVTRRVAR